MDKIKMGNGAVYNCSFLSVIPSGTAFVALEGVSWLQMSQIFGNQNSTCRMEYGNYVLTGFTELVSIGKQPYGLQAILKGGTAQERS